VTFTIHLIVDVLSGKNGDKDSEFNGLPKTKMLKILQRVTKSGICCLMVNSTNKLRAVPWEVRRLHFLLTS